MERKEGRQAQPNRYLARKAHHLKSKKHILNKCRVRKVLVGERVAVKSNQIEPRLGRLIGGGSRGLPEYCCSVHWTWVGEDYAVAGGYWIGGGIRSEEPARVQIDSSENETEVDALPWTRKVAM